MSRTFLLAAFAGLVFSSCYSPVIGEGDFLCGPAGGCPTGMTCRADNRCYRANPGADASTSDVPITPPVPPPDAGMMMCSRQLSCSPGSNAAALCDPVCQTGCACDKKCSFMGPNLVCGAIPQSPKGPYEDCNPAADNCVPGFLCTEELRPEACGSKCYRACREDSDCGANARCNDQLGDPSGNKLLTKICSPRIENCNPVGAQPMCSNSGQGNRSFPSFACYLLDPGKDESAVCKCSGMGELDAMCAGRGDCRPGLECLAGLAPDTGMRCRRLCNLMGIGAAATCVLPRMCRPIGPGTRVGACI